MTFCLVFGASPDMAYTPFGGPVEEAVGIFIMQCLYTI